MRASGGAALFEFDLALGRRLVAGADEAGRGSLAGPLVAAAVLLDYRILDAAALEGLARLDDSKRHSAQSRERLYPVILALARRVALAARSAESIDRHGLHVTNISALRDCLAAAAEPGCICLTDGFAVPDVGHPQRAVVGGDALSAAVAAASVVAKVARDRFMRRADSRFPGWGFAANAGYSTAEHRTAIADRGVSELHRRSFRSVAYEQLRLGTYPGRQGTPECGT